jgi:hypothetical protein
MEDDTQNMILRTAVGGEVLREHVAAAALRAFVKAHLLVRRTKELSADDVTGSARLPDSTAVFRMIAQRYKIMSEHLDEHTRRLFVASEASVLGYGGVSKVA